jgi:hypothetical protein
MVNCKHKIAEMLHPNSTVTVLTPKESNVFSNTVLTPKESNVYSNMVFHPLYDSFGVAPGCKRPNFYKHAIPLGLKKTRLIRNYN